MTEPEPSVDELVATWDLLSGATTAVAVRLAASLAEDEHLALPAFEVLLRLLRDPGHRMPTADLAAGAGLTAGGFTTLLDRLELARLVERTRRPTDRPVDDVTLTDHGHEVASRALTRYAEDLRRHLLAPLGAARLAELASLTRVVRGHHGG